MTISDQTIIGNCTFCSGIVRIRFDVDPGTSVRCPHCGEVSRLGTLLNAAVPELEIVDPAENEDSSHADTIEVTNRTIDGKLVVSPILSKGAKRKSRKRSSDKPSWQRATPEITVPSAEILDETPKVPNVSEGASRSPSSTRSHRRRSRSSSSGDSFHRNPQTELIKIIAGALLAFPVAQILMWWVINVDPLDLGPPISKGVPIIVPQKFHADREEERPKRRKNESATPKDEKATEEPDERVQPLPPDSDPNLMSIPSGTDRGDNLGN